MNRVLNRYKSFALFIASLFLMIAIAQYCYATENLGDSEDASLPIAEEITPSFQVKTAKGGPVLSMLDREPLYYSQIAKGDALILHSENQMAYGVYLVFDGSVSPWTLSVGDQIYPGGTDGFLAEYIDISATPSADIRIEFPQGAKLNEIYLFGQGTLPDWVQVWEPCCEKADLLLLSTHGDDEHLFFAGILPYYAVARDLNVQVVYFTNHGYDNRPRIHEILDGLWKVGIRNYPYFSPFHDIYAESLEEAQTLYAAAGETEEQMISWQIEMIRRFRPQVVICHDWKGGEYGNGTHMLSTDTFLKALQPASDSSSDPESYRKYGTWDVPKVYIHLYRENPILLKMLDVPMECFDGKTPFQMGQEGFLCHRSQHNLFWYQWLMGSSYRIDKAEYLLSSQYSPSKFGLYRSTVGKDLKCDDFFENLIPYAQQTNSEETPPPPQPDKNGNSQTDLNHNMAGSQTNDALSSSFHPEDPGVEQISLQRKLSDVLVSNFTIYVIIILLLVILLSLGIYLLEYKKRKRMRK